VKPESFSWYHPDYPICVQSDLISQYSKDFLHFYLTGMFWDLQTWILDLYIDVFWQRAIQRGHSAFVRIALPSSLMLWQKVVPSDGIGKLPLIRGLCRP
jgi:hypothetical protein